MMLSELHQLNDGFVNIFPKIVQEGKLLRAYDTPEYIKDMGTPDRLQHISEDVRSGLVASLNRKISLSVLV